MPHNWRILGRAHAPQLANPRTSPCPIWRISWMGPPVQLSRMDPAPYRANVMDKIPWMGPYPPRDVTWTGQKVIPIFKRHQLVGEKLALDERQQKSLGGAAKVYPSLPGP